MKKIKKMSLKNLNRFSQKHHAFVLGNSYCFERFMAKINTSNGQKRERLSLNVSHIYVCVCVCVCACVILV